MTGNRPRQDAVASKCMMIESTVVAILSIENNGEPIEIGIAGSQTVTLQLVVPLTR